MTSRLEVSRDQVLAYRRAANHLDERLPPGPESLRLAGWCGLQDSMPRAALLSIHARVAETRPSTWEDPALVQLWGPRFSAFVVPAEDRWVFTLGRLPDEPSGLRRATDTAERLDRFLRGRRMSYADAGHGMGISPNFLRYGAPTGRILMRWEGARRPVVWTVPAPEVDPEAARLELARRFFHVYGPNTAAAFGDWAGIRPPRAKRIVAALSAELVPVATPIGSALALAADEAALREPPGTRGNRGDARLLPSGDALYLLWERDRELLVPDADRRPELWTPRVWPGAILVAGEIAGTWSRADAKVLLAPWRTLTRGERDAVQREAESLPIPGFEGRMRVAWAA